MSKNLFITGMGRSGTTLVDKMCGSLSECESFSQPLPLLLVHLKADFLRFLGVSDSRLKYPLSDQQYENDYDINEFISFLKNHELSSAKVSPILKQMISYSGQIFKPHDTLSSTDKWKGDSLAEFVNHYFREHSSDKTHVYNTFAWKEIVAEEFIPYLIDNGFFVLLLIRDPRDVITSMLKPEGDIYTGAPRPLLWMVRHWRKSVAYLHHYENHNNVRAAHYEDLVFNPDSFINEWEKWLDIETSLHAVNLTDKNGLEWLGNSSFTPHKGISTKSVGNHKKHLPAATTKFIESLCYAEMKAMGYEPTICADEVEGLLRTGPKEDFLGREALSKYSYSKKRRDEELNRWKSLTESKKKYESNDFIFKRNFQELFRIMRTK